jgi:hypothetical protein
MDYPKLLTLFGFLLSSKESSHKISFLLYLIDGFEQKDFYKDLWERDSSSKFNSQKGL